MKSYKYVIIGAGLGGHQAAAGIRKIDRQQEILLIGQEPRRPYNRPPLTKEYMQGKKPLEKAFCAEEDFYADNGIALRTGVSVIKLDSAAKRVVLDDGQEFLFEKAIYATGGRPMLLDLPGANQPNVTYFRTMDDAVGVFSSSQQQARRVVVLGGGFIGMELASSLTMRGCQVHVIDSGPYVWRRFADRQLAEYFMGYCRSRGVTFHMGQRATEIRSEGGRAVSMVTTAGETIEGDLFIIAAGIVPNVELAQQAGLACENGVLVNEYLQTSNGDIYAVGDVANYPDPVFNKRRRVEHWGQADYTGDLAGQNAAGAGRKYDLLTYVWSDIFDLHLEFSGIEQDYDRLLFRGRMEDNRFAILHLREGHMTAYYSVNLPKKDYQALGKLIENKIDLTGHDADLSTPDFNLENLLTPVAAK